MRFEVLIVANVLVYRGHIAGRIWDRSGWMRLLLLRLFELGKQGLRFYRKALSLLDGWFGNPCWLWSDQVLFGAGGVDIFETAAFKFGVEVKNVVAVLFHVIRFYFHWRPLFFVLNEADFFHHQADEAWLPRSSLLKRILEDSFLVGLWLIVWLRIGGEYRFRFWLLFEPIIIH